MGTEDRRPTWLGHIWGAHAISQSLFTVLCLKKHAYYENQKYYEKQHAQQKQRSYNLLVKSKNNTYYDP